MAIKDLLGRYRGTDIRDTVVAGRVPKVLRDEIKVILRKYGLTWDDLINEAAKELKECALERDISDPDTNQ